MVHVLPSEDLELPNHLTCRSCDTVAEVRARLMASRPDSQLEQCHVFALPNGLWQREGSGCHTLAALEALLGHFEACPETQRLSRLGMADGACELLLVPRRWLSVQVQVYHGEDFKGLRQLRVAGSMRLKELSRQLIRSLRQSPLEDLTPSEIARHGIGVTEMS